MVKSFAQGKPFIHPVLDDEGWWKRTSRISYFLKEEHKSQLPYMPKASRPIIIIGKTGTLGRAFGRICTLRGINHLLLGRTDFNIAHPAEIEKIILQYKPWAILNAAGFVRVDEAESDAENCFLINSIAPEQIATQCNKHGIKFMTFSS